MKTLVFIGLLATLATAGGAVKVEVQLPRLSFAEWSATVAQFDAQQGQDGDIYAGIAHLAREGYRLGQEACHE